MEEQITALLKIKGKEAKAFDTIVEFYSERLYWHIRRIVMQHDDADDVLQNTFIKVWQNLTTFRGDSKLYTWLYRIATNEALAHLRKQRKLRIVDNEPFANDHAGDIYFDAQMAEAQLYKAIATLPDKQKLVFNMRYFEEMSYEQIAGITGTSVGALKASYHHAVNKIQDLLGSED